MAERKGRPIKELLRAAIETSVPLVPAQFDKVEGKFVYIPERHIRALEPDTMLVTGIRGAEKSFWWYLLQKDSLRNAILRPGIAVSVGFGQGASANWPNRDELQQLLSKGYKPRLIWKAVVLRQIIPDDNAFGGWEHLVQSVVENPSSVATYLRDFDAKLEQGKQSHIVLFDALDRTADTRVDRERLLSGLLELVLELRAYRALRAKVFARPDMLTSPEVRSFSDASKVLASGASLEWRTVDLYGLLFQYLGNANDEEAAAAFRQITTKRRATASVPGGPTWIVPDTLRNDADRQKSVF